MADQLLRRCEVMRDDEHECGRPAIALVNGFPICDGCREDYRREKLIESEEALQ